MSILDKVYKAGIAIIEECSSKNMVTSSTSRDNKNYYRYEDNIFLAKKHVKKLLDKILLDKDEMNYIEEVKIICQDYIINNDIELNSKEKREPITCSVELNNVTSDKFQFLIEHRDFFNIQVYLEPTFEKEIMSVSLVDKLKEYNSVYIKIFDVISCYDSSIDMYNIFQDELNYTLQKIYEYNNDIKSIDSYSLHLLEKRASEAFDGLTSLWDKMRFSNELYDLVNKEINYRISLVEGDNKEKAFTSDDVVSFELFLLEDSKYLNQYVEAAKSTYVINNNNNTVSIQIPIRKLRDSLNVIDSKSDKIAEDVMKLLEPIGEYVNN